MSIFGSKGSSGFSGSSTAEEVTHGIDATGLTAIVTGTTNGIGLVTARVLALRGAHVVMAVRNIEAGHNVKEKILKQIPGVKIDVMFLDLSSLASVRKFASDYVASGLPLNLLINNAGIVPASFKISEDNIELCFATNHLGPFLLTYLLLETMKKTAFESKREGRIVNVSSYVHNCASPEGFALEKINDQSRFSTFRTYRQTKLANILHAKELARIFKEEGVNITANALHPGGVNTNIISSGGPIMALLCRPFFKNVEQGAATTCYVALHPQLKGVSGEYFQDCNMAEPNYKARDAELARRLWEFSFNLTKS
ncbi:hypothetical protein K2173_022687 [Erythroxylum novogranatense]|uniref:Short-chain dehydrogenase TIC 32, chloroplastic-like n=1 Tax=Erythroxylum novogranatense TaxID=1862640 RepID=A0AAV8TR69_9ROSI|nr:hypothetical protein K2173_022687 [Erythroxylum novogranatense]